MSYVLYCGILLSTNRNCLFTDTHSYIPIAHRNLLCSIMSGLKVVVGVKRVIDYAVKIAVKAEGVNLANVKMSMNPFWYVLQTILYF